MASPSNGLRMNKSKVKTKFTKTKNKILNLLDSDLIDKQSVKELGSLFDAVLDDAMVVLEELCNVYKDQTEYENAQKVSDEIDQMKKEYNETTQELYAKLQTLKSTNSVSSGENEQEDLTKDLWRQMKRVGIPVFYGDKRKYDSWKAAFMACVDKAPATPEYKLLQLRQYSKGDALQAIGDLGHSMEAYEAAKERLERKFGGERRKLMRFLDGIEQFPSLKTENPKEVERFADLLDVAVINLKEAKKEEDLGNGALYLELQRKLPERMLGRFHRWLFETKEEESVETLRMRINQESKYLLIASETKYGLANSNSEKSKDKRGANRSYFTENSPRNECKVCHSSQHKNIWDCEIFKAKDTSGRWQTAKELGLCFRCLRNNHQGKNCSNFRVCGLQRCIKNHHRLLHKQPSLNSEAPASVPQTTQNSHANESQRAFYARKSQVALRTVPVIVSAEGTERKILINALLDDGSTKTYINHYLAGELGLQGKLETVQVNTLNDKVQSFETMTVNLTVESLNGQLQTEVEAFVLDNVTGLLETVNWNDHVKEWEHLKGIEFPVIGQNKNVDMLIGLDYASLHSSLHEIYGKPGEPIARLTPLGWTCVGQLDGNKHDTLFSTYFLTQEEDLDQMLKGFWEIDNYGSQVKENSLTPIDERVYKDSIDNMTFKDGRYEVKIPWKCDPNEIPDNYEMAAKRLDQTEKKLKKDPNIESIYRETIENYLKKRLLASGTY